VLHASTAAAPAARVGYAIFDAERRLQYASATFSALLGAHPPATLLSDILPLFAGVDAPLQAVANSDLPRWHLRAVAHPPGADAPSRYLELTLFPHLQPGSLFLTVRDVTWEIAIEQRAIQERNELRLLQTALAAHTPALTDLRQRAEMENSEHTLFQALLTGDLRSPLTALTSYIHWLLAAEAHPLHPDQRQALEKMQSYAAEIAASVDDMINVERVERGLLSLPMGPFDLASVAERAHAASLPLAQAAGVHLHLSLHPLPGAFGLASLLYEALIELLRNAILFNRPGGEVHLRARPAGTEMLIEVADTGPGIPAAVQSRLFRPFQRGDSASARSRRGGLGLFLVRMIVEAHGGALHLHSEEGKGATFTIRLPGGADPTPAP